MNNNETKVSKYLGVEVISSKYKGVYKTYDGKFQTRVKTAWGRKCYVYGPFPTAEEAARHYDIEVLDRDPFGSLNFEINETNETQSGKYMGVEKRIVGYNNVYETYDGKFQTKIKQKYPGEYFIYGPFQTAEEAARHHDIEVLKKYPDRTLNFPSDNEIEINLEKKVKTMKRKIDETDGSNDISKKQIGKAKSVRKHIPNRIRHTICANQKKICNLCLSNLGKNFIIDHIIALFLGGSNEISNLQALCYDCHHFKTHKLDRSLKFKKPLTVEDVLRLQKEHYCKMKCIDPSTLDKDASNEEYKLNPTKIRKMHTSDELESLKEELHHIKSENKLIKEAFRQIITKIDKAVSIEQAITVIQKTIYDSLNREGYMIFM
jgi:5-methylcytosine-specific restriction enzyme A